MNDRAIQIEAASRLHFGLFAFGRNGARERNYGGVGMMIAQPSLEISISPAREFVTSGPLSNRVSEFASRWAKHARQSLPPCEVAVRSVPPEHSGFGLGTQLGLSVAAGLNAYFGQAGMNAAQLAEVTGRGQRSAVGLYGFLHGGLIVEDGKLPAEDLSPLTHREVVPADWRVVLLIPNANPGLSGTQEQAAFASSPPVEPTVSLHLREEVSQRMLPALRRKDFAGFSRSVSAYGEMAGSCFAATQGGPYNGEKLTKVVRAVRELGVEGVGQSSWGPGIYCLLQSQSAAESFRDRVRDRLVELDINCVIAQPCNHGAVVRTHPGANPTAFGLSCSLSSKN